MQDVAQLVRALVCGAGGRGFEPHLPAKGLVEQTRPFCCLLFNYESFSNQIVSDWTLSKNYLHRSYFDVRCRNYWFIDTFNSTLF